MLKILREEKGSAIVIVTICLTVLIGMAALVVDTGLMYYTRSKLQNAADAAALAEAQDIAQAMADDLRLTDGRAVFESEITLPNAEARINEYAELNGCVAEDLTATEFVYLSDASNLRFNGIPVGIKVDASKDINLIFARIWGESTSTIVAHAEAQAGVVTGAIGVAPVSVLDQTLSTPRRWDDSVNMIQNYDKLDQMTADQLKALPGGWFGYLNVADSHATRVIESQIRDGITVDLQEGQEVPGTPGLKAADINDRSVIVELYNQCLAQDASRNSPAGACTISPKNYQDDCPRLRVVPIVEVAPDSGSGNGAKLIIKGFCLSMFDDATNDLGWRLHGSYLTGVVPKATSINVNAIGTIEDYGSYGFLLTD